MTSMACDSVPESTTIFWKCRELAYTVSESSNVGAIDSNFNQILTGRQFTANVFAAVIATSKRKRQYRSQQALLTQAGLD